MDNFLKKVFQESHYEMGNQRSCSSGSSLSFDEIEKQLNLLIELPETELLPTFSPILIQEKLKYFQLVSQNIEVQKANFLSDYKKTKNSINQLFESIGKLLKDRQDALERELLNKGKEKIALWNHQISTCQVIQEWLKQSSVIDNKINQHTVKNFFNELTKDIEFIDPGTVHFNAGYEEIIQFLRNMGQLIYSENLKLIAPKFVIGRSGNGPSEFCRPWGVSTDSMGHIFISDRSNHRIQVFNQLGEFIFEFGKEGSQPGEFNRPAGIAVNKKSEIIVCDKDNHRIQIFTTSGRFIAEFGSAGSEPGQFMYPWGVAVNKNCEIAISDSKNHRIQLFNEFGKYINYFDAKKLGIERPRLQAKFLDCPRGLAFRPDGSLLVTDFNNHRLLIISKNFDRFKTVGCEGNEPGQFFRPQGIASDDFGRFAVADCKNYRIQIFDANNCLIKIFGNQGDAPGQFDCPQGISFHPNGSIVVVDFNNDRVQVF